ncbi:hypothetical protein F8388_022367 [Cannabis sativa]|uniref:Uncharacterized protein n=1 Tax=Cannabis sativa TaxID=3483 RepID=A0A7J6G6D7_CANSA|nr:hypothetical protein F8388_022367 [Cannabis sativa]
MSKKGEELHSAARSGDLSAVQSILAADPLSINSRDKHSRTPLHLAAWSGKTDVVSYLCKHGGDIGASAMDDMGAIHFAAQKGHLEVVRTLLSSGASIKAITRKGLAPLHYAVQGSHLELVKYLVKKGANLSLKTKAGKTPLDLASNDEIRSYLEECKTSSFKPDHRDELKAEESNQQSFEKKEDNSCSEAAESAHVEIEDQGLKRKSDEDDSKEATVEPKKKKVVLSHLLSADDTQDDEENE